MSVLEKPQLNRAQRRRMGRRVYFTKGGGVITPFERRLLTGDTKTYLKDRVEVRTREYK